MRSAVPDEAVIEEKRVETELAIDDRPLEVGGRTFSGFRVYVGLMLGLYRDNSQKFLTTLIWLYGDSGKEMETTVMGLYGV